ncbi:MAG TPA: hypothetical protein VK206_01055, partial [Anaerolineales bacterium]|nr:hypothetical protein [Anaerolineales bacterium]
NGTATMSMAIYNPNPYPLTVKDVHVIWNAATGGSGQDALTLQRIIVGGVLWTVNDSTGDFVDAPPSVAILDSGSSGILFTFDQNYVNMNGSESIVIHLSTPGCEGYPIQSPTSTSTPTP